MTPWATALKIPSGTMTRMFREGIPPTYETLSKMMRTENVSLSWLLGANCPAYLYTATTSDAATAEEVEIRVTDERGWRIHVLSDGDACAVVLTQPACFIDKAARIDYFAVEVICGPVGERTAAVLAIGAPDNVGQLVKLTRDQMQTIYREGVGSFQLIGGHGVPGLLDLKGLADDWTPERLAAFRIEAGACADLDPAPEDGVPAALSRLVHAWARFTDSERQAVGVLVEPLIERARARVDPLAVSTGYVAPGP